MTNQPGHIDEEKAAKYMLQLFGAVSHCHALNIVHRDIKPGNIMITEDDNVKLIDFGLSVQSQDVMLSLPIISPPLS